MDSSESDSEFDVSASDIDYVPSDSSFLESFSDDSDKENTNNNSLIENIHDQFRENTESLSGDSHGESIWSDYQSRHKKFQFDGICFFPLFDIPAFFRMYIVQKIIEKSFFYIYT